MTTPDATSFQVRAELEDLLERDLLGPWDGPQEELPPATSPAERYMLGRLVPRQQPEEPADDEQLEPELVDREVASPGVWRRWRGRRRRGRRHGPFGINGSLSHRTSVQRAGDRRCDQRDCQVGPV